MKPSGRVGARDCSFSQEVTRRYRVARVLASGTTPVKVERNLNRLEVSKNTDGPFQEELCTGTRIALSSASRDRDMHEVCAANQA
jgi:hypothetical protein